jgi:hypothetical protein
MADEKALCSLIETRAYRHCLERLEIWRWVLEAIQFDQWIDEATEGERAYSGGMLQAVKGGFDPVTTRWGREYGVSEAAFDKWLKEAKRSHQFPASPKRRAGRKPTKRDAIAERYNGVLPVDSSYKQIANEFGTSVSTAKRAFGGK